MTDDPGVSVVLATLGHDLADVERAIQSVDAQTTDAELELILVDGSEDRVTQTFADREWSRIDRVVVVEDPATGLSAARNLGFEAATCEFVALHDDDDVWYPEKLERQLALFDDPDVGLVACGVRRIDTDGTVVSSYRARNVTGDTEAILRGARVGPSPTLVVRRSLFTDAGVRFDEEMPCYEDRDWFIRLSQHCEFDAVPEPLVDKGMQGEHLSSNADLALRAYPRFLAKYDSLAASFGTASALEFRSSVYMLGVSGSCNAGEYRTANRLAWQALRANPRNTTAAFYFLATLGGGPTVTLARALKRTVVDMSEAYRSRSDTPTSRPGLGEDRSRQSNS
ncbi:glycosyltransferase family 2 protein [Salinirubrum litoreum]|uniref:Glycosyltransferase family 2 protein n=1 Tax=Salinirubrum litoreum TaxID=1126234 RepID=A0ABD5RCI4_9EURY|nr:glycosyltransferase [Salinirubrum litoreum]